MPDTDGLALAAEIRKRAELSATRIILLSSGTARATGTGFARCGSTPTVR